MASEFDFSPQACTIGVEAIDDSFGGFSR